MSSVFDMSSVQSGSQRAAESVASSLAPRKTAPMTAMSTSAPAASASSASTSGDITSADFLTLLVSELKNQDPTQPTDPNAYITQLVGVNSLQQLISINQGITSLDSPAASGAVTAAQPIGAAAGIAAATPSSSSAATMAAAQMQSQQTMFGQGSH